MGLKAMEPEGLQVSCAPAGVLCACSKCAGRVDGSDMVDPGKGGRSEKESQGTQSLSC